MRTSYLLGMVCVLLLRFGGPAFAQNVITGSIIEFGGPDDLLFDPSRSVIAVDVYGNADSMVNGVQFYTDRNGLGAGVTAEGVVSSGGVTVTNSLTNQIDNWAAAPNFSGGTPGSAAALSGIMQDIRWANAGAGQQQNVQISGLTPGSTYNLQLLFNEGADRNRRWDIGVDGLLVVDDFTSEGAGVWSPNNSFAYSGDFDPGADGILNIVMGLEPFPLDPNNTPNAGGDNNAILQGIVLHDVTPAAAVPEPGTFALFGIVMAVLMSYSLWRKR